MRRQGSASAKGGGVRYQPHMGHSICEHSKTLPNATPDVGLGVANSGRAGRLAHPRPQVPCSAVGLGVVRAFTGACPFMEDTALVHRSACRQLRGHGSESACARAPPAVIYSALMPRFEGHGQAGEEAVPLQLSCWSLNPPPRQAASKPHMDSECLSVGDLDARGQRYGKRPVSGTADRRNNQTGQFIQGLR